MPGIGFDIFAKDKGASAAFEKIAKNADATKDAMQRVAKANDDASAASARLRKTQAAEADAIGKVRVAAAKLEDIRGNAKAKTGQIAAAEEALAAAQRKAADAADANAAATKRAATAQDAAKGAAKQLADAQSSAFDKVSKKAQETAGKVGAAGEESGRKFTFGFSQRLPALGSRISTFFKTGVGAAAGLAAGALAGAGFASAFSGALEQGSAKAKLQGQLGLSGADAAKAGKIAGDLYTANYGDSLGGVNDAIKSVIQNTNVGLNSIDLKPVTAKVLDLAGVFDQDLGAVTRAVGQSIRTGLAKNATEALDFITKGFQIGNDKAEDFLDTLNEYGTQFRKVGIDGKTATGLISQGLKAGARDADIVADAIKEFSIRAIDGSTTTADGFKKLGLSAKSMSETIAKGGKPAAAGLDLVLDRLRGIKDPVKQSQIAVELFGTQAEDLGKALFALDPSHAVKALGDVAGAAGKLDQAVGTTPQAVISSFFRTIKQGSIDSIGGLISAFVTGKTEAKGFQGVLEHVGIGARIAFDKARDGVDALKGLGKKVVQAIGPVDLSGVATGIFNDTKAWAGSVISGFKSGLDSGDWKPLGKSLGDGVIRAIQTLGDKSGAILVAVGGLIDKVDWKSLGGKISSGITGLFEGVDWKTLGSSLGDAAINILGKASGLGVKLGTAFKDVVNRIDWKKIGNDSTGAIIGFVSGVDWGQVAKSLGIALLKSLKIDVQIKDAIVNASADLVVGMFKAIIDAMSVWRVNVTAYVKEVGGDLVSGLWSGITSAMKGVGGFLKSVVVDPVVGWVKSLFGVRSPSTVFASIGVQLIAGLKGGVTAGVRGIGSWIYRAVIVPSVTPFATAGTWLVRHGQNAVAGFKNGVATIAAGIGKWIYGQVISPLVSPFNNKPGTWLLQQGKNVIAGFKAGMVSIWGDVTKWVGGIATWIKDHKGPVSLDGRLLIPAGKAIMSGFLKGLKSGAGPAWDFVSKVGGKTKDALSAAVGGPFMGGGKAPTDRAGIVALMRTVASAYGWGSGPQWDSLYNLEMGEAGFNPNAQNPTSTAYGLGQFLNSTWAQTGISKTSDPWRQAQAMMIYIKRNYGSPANAFASWSGRSPHWYEKGTPWVPNDQLAFLHKGEGVIPAPVNRARLRAASGGSQTVVLEFRSDGSPHMDWLIREFRKYVQINGGNVQQAVGTNR